MHQPDERGAWSRRYKANVARLASGDLAQVTQVIADLEQGSATPG